MAADFRALFYGHGSRDAGQQRGSQSSQPQPEAWPCGIAWATRWRGGRHRGWKREGRIAARRGPEPREQCGGGLPAGRGVGSWTLGGMDKRLMGMVLAPLRKSFKVLPRGLMLGRIAVGGMENIFIIIRFSFSGAI